MEKRHTSREAETATCHGLEGVQQTENRLQTHRRAAGFRFRLKAMGRGTHVGGGVGTAGSRGTEGKAARRRGDSDNAKETFPSCMH